MVSIMSQATANDTADAARADWLGILGRARPQDLEERLGSRLDYIEYTWLRKPQIGLAMVRGRAGGTGAVFNLGEMTVTRCALRLEDGTVGVGYVQGRGRRHSRFAALLDGLLQTAQWHDELMRDVIGPLRHVEAARRAEKSRKAASTKVEFFTLVRGENPA